MTKFLRTPFLQNMSGRLFLKFVQYLFLESFCASLDKSVLLHRRYLMSKFTEMLILLFIRLYMKIFSIAWQEFNPFYPHRVLCDRKHFCSILTDLSNHLFLFHKIKQWMLRVFLPNSFQRCRSSRSQMFFRSSRPEMFCKKAVLRDFPKFTRKHLCQSLFITKVAGQGRQLYLKRDPVSWCFLWILQNLDEHLFLQNTTGGCF